MTQPQAPLDSLTQLIASLKERLDLSGEQIADVLWLTLKRQEFEQSQKTEFVKPDDGAEEDAGEEEDETGGESPSDGSGGGNSEIEKPPKEPPLHPKVPVYPEGSSPSGQGLPLWVPDAPSLREPIHLAQSLRPLMRRVATGRMTVLDEVATVRRIAEEGICIPVLQSEAEPWLDLALVVDESQSMLIWRHTIRDLQRLLTHYGIFRDIRVFGIKPDETGEKLQIFSRMGSNHRLIDPKELVDPTGRRLVLVVSDCVSNIWRKGIIFPTLQEWTHKQPLAVVQMLPEWMWKQTALGLGTAVGFSSSIIGVANRGLLVNKKFLSEQRTKIPILTLDLERAAKWGQMLVGKADASVSGYILPAQLNIASHPKLESQQRAIANLDAPQRVQRFRKTTSPLGRKLAGLLAAAPTINLPIVRLIQETLLPQSRSVQVAEVFLGGLLKPKSAIAADTNPDMVEYDFIAPECRDILLEDAPVSDSTDVLNAVSRYVAEQMGKSLDEFMALLKAPGTQEGEQVKPFAEVTARILRKLGGDYIRLADQLESPNGTDDVTQHLNTENDHLSILRTAITRIFNREGEVVGGGFLVAGRSQNYILTLTDVANQAQVDTTDFDFVPITMTEPQNKVARPRGEIHLDFFEIAAEQKLKAKVVFRSPVYQSPTEPVGFAVLQLEEQLPLGVQAIELLSAHDMQNHHARIFDFPPVGLRNSASSGMLGSKNEDGLVQIEAFIADPIFGGTPVWDEDLKGVVGMAVNLGLRQNINDVFMIPTDVLVKAWDKFKVRHLLSQQGNTRIYSLCTDEPWNLPFDAFVIPVGVGVDLTGSLASALKKHIGEANSLQLEEAIQHVLEQKNQTMIAPEDPLIVLLPAEINSLLNPAESDREHFLICATVESPRPTIENAAKAVEAAITLSLERKLKRIVVSLLGTGVNRLPVDEVAKAMLSKLHQVLSESSSNSIEKIIFVDRKESAIAIVNQAAQDLEGYYNDTSSSTIPNLSELLPYEPDALSVLEFVERRNSEGHDTSEEDVTKLFNKPKGDDGIYYLLENLRILGFLAITKAGEGSGTVRYDLAPQYLETRLPQPLPTPQGEEFASRQEHLYNAQKRLLALIVEKSRQQQDTTQADTKSLFDRSKENLARYRRLEHLRLLGFLRKTDAGTGIETSKYNLTPKYLEYLGQEHPPTNLLSFEFDIATITFQETLRLEPFVYDVGTIEVVESRNLFRQKKTEIHVRKHKQSGEQFVELLKGNVRLEMVSIPTGRFMMGAPKGKEVSDIDEEPQHPVSIKTFFLGKYPVTQAQYEAVMDKNPSSFKEESDSPDRPVEKVLWDDAVEFCRRLSEQTSKEYRLPSEAEWEYACRAGTNTPFHFGETISTDIANYRGTDKKENNWSGSYGRGVKGIFREKTTPVGSFEVANAFGLFDMHGNVWEWCADNSHPNYKGAPSDGSAWLKDGDKSAPLLRGGAWDEAPQYCRSACRANLKAGPRMNAIGFRVACSARGLL